MTMVDQADSESPNRLGWGQGALVAGESMLIFAFAATALEAAMQSGWLLPFRTSSQAEEP